MLPKVEKIRGWEGRGQKQEKNTTMQTQTKTPPTKQSQEENRGNSEVWILNEESSKRENCKPHHSRRDALQACTSPCSAASLPFPGDAQPGPAGLREAPAAKPPRGAADKDQAGAGSHKHRAQGEGNAEPQIKQPRAARIRMPECLPPWNWEQSQMLINTRTGAQHVTRHVSRAPGKPPFPLLVSERDRKIPSSLALPFPPPVPGSSHPCKKFPSLLTSPLSQMHCLQMFPKNAL